MDPKETTIPAVLVGVGIAVEVAHGVWTAGAGGAGIALAGVAITFVIGVPLGILACFITASLMQASFGTLQGAILKLAAAFVFPSASSLIFPAAISWLVAMVLYWGLLKWLFELEALEVLVLVVVLTAVNFVAIYLAALALVSLGGGA